MTVADGTTERQRVDWTPERLDWLIGNYSDITRTVGEMAAVIGCSESALQYRAHQLGLRRDKAALSRHLQALAAGGPFPPVTGNPRTAFAGGVFLDSEAAIADPGGWGCIQWPRMKTVVGPWPFAQARSPALNPRRRGPKNV